MYEFMGEHQVLTVILALIAGSVAIWPFRLVNRWIRHRNIVARGWPTHPQMDADGDIVEPRQ